jgi:hypothetical protein
MAFERRFWPMLAAVFTAGWLGGAPAAALWCLIGAYAIVDVLRAGGLGRRASTESRSAP